MIHKIIERVLDECLRIQRFQNWVNSRSYHQYGCLFKPLRSNATIGQVFDEYLFFDIQKGDVILDIGANIGGFSLFASKQAKHVFSVEPIMTEQLKANIELNQFKNITVLDTCLGDNIVDIEWLGKTRSLIGSSLTDLKEMCGGQVDFLKCDCEGAEWCITSEELIDIRRVEMEVHSTTEDIEGYLIRLDDAGFKYDAVSRYDPTNKKIPYTMIVHAWRG